MLTYRTEKGAPLTVDEMDGNFRDLDERLKILETHLDVGEGIGTILSQGNLLTIMGTRGSELGTFPLPKFTLSPRGAWSPDVSYHPLDLVVHGHTLYYCLQEYISGTWEEESDFWQQIVDFSPPPPSQTIYEKATLPAQETIGKTVLLMEETGPTLVFFNGNTWQRLLNGGPL